MALFKEMDRRNKVFVPSFKYLGEIAEVTHPRPLIKNLQKKQLLKVTLEDRLNLIEIRLIRGKSEKIPETFFLLKGKWTKTLMLTFFLLKGDREYLWTEIGELMNLFKCSGRTISIHLKELDEKGLILRERYKDKYKITLMI